MTPSLRPLLALTPLLALAPLLPSCSESSSSPEARDAGTTTDGDARKPPPVDPTLFDCTSLAKPPLPRRASSTPACLRDPACKGRFVVAHRGAGGDLGRIAPEDTLAAYRAAIAIGADIVETDPRPTSDGVIVNMHDTTVDRTTDGTGQVAAMTFDQIRKLHIKNDEGRFAGDYSCEKVPTLEEILVTSRGRALVLVDANKSDRVEAMVEAITKAGALEWAVFDTDDTSKIDRALAIEPRLMIQPRAETTEAIAPLLVKYAEHLPVFVEISMKIFPKGATEVHAAGTRVLTNAFVADVGVITGDDRKVYLGFFDSGADALQTELPDELLKTLGRF